MRISAEKLSAEAEATGFRPDVLEKVAQSMGLLDALRSHHFLGDLRYWESFFITFALDLAHVLPVKELQHLSNSDRRHIGRPKAWQCSWSEQRAINLRKLRLLRQDYFKVAFSDVYLTRASSPDCSYALIRTHEPKYEIPLFTPEG